MNPTSGDVTRLLQEFRTGDQAAVEELFRVAYSELRRIAGRYIRKDRQNHTLQPTALVNEAYLRINSQRSTKWRDRSHFYAVAALAMRRILVDYARRANAERRAGKVQRVPLDDNLIYTKDKSIEVLAVDEALERLHGLHVQQARVVELRYFGGLKVEEIAETVGIQPRTVEKYLKLARAWLQVELERQGSDDAS